MEDYVMAPCWNSSQYQLSYFRFTIFYKNTIPVLTLELKGPGDLHYSSKRQEAIQEVQRRLKDLGRQYYYYLITKFFLSTMLTASLFGLYSRLHPT
jgi:hypothetical protein